MRKGDVEEIKDIARKVKQRITKLLSLPAKINLGWKIQIEFKILLIFVKAPTGSKSNFLSLYQIA